jgi:ABC-type uncharacterized transport system involved in gliding motility auxiliary subunit
VRDLLREYEGIARGKIKLEVIDPEPLTEQEDLAVAQGVTGAPIGTGEKIYFGLVGTNQVNGRAVIPFFLEDREKYLEYDLTNLVFSLVREKKTKVGIVSNLPFDTGAGGMMEAMQGRSRSFMIYEEILNSFETQFLEQDFDRVPADIDVVMIAHPKPLNDKTQYALDQFIMRGGRALVFLDPWSEIGQVPATPAGQPLEGATPSSANSIDKLMQSWGVTIDANHIVGLLRRSQQVRFGDDVINYVVWAGLKAEDIDRDDPVMGELTDINLGSMGSIRHVKGATSTFTPMLVPKDQGMPIDVAKMKGSPNPVELLREFSPTDERFTLAARISGTLKSAFAAPPPVEAPKPGMKPPEPLPAHLAQSKGPANIILVADSDIFNDSFWVQTQELQGQRVAVPVAHNAAFVLNAIENLSGSNALISLRSRGTSKRSFDVVDDIRAKAGSRLKQEEEALQQRLTATQNRLAELEGRRGAASRPGATQPQDLLTPEQEAEMEKFRQDLVQTRSALREVQHKLRRDIDRLGTWLAAINILLVPLMVVGAAIALAFLNRKKKPSASAS